MSPARGRALPLEIRVGLPSPGGGLARAARAFGYKVMVSANSFFRRDHFGDVLGVRRPGKDLAGLDASLDSSGFVAMQRYGGYTWTIEAYLYHVVAAFPWQWYSAPDYSCEPAVAGCPTTVRFRQAATVAMYSECARVAARAGLPAPVPVLQGWRPEDYHRCWDMLALGAGVPLVGIGSVCSRSVHGPDGLMAVLERVDRVLPPEVQLHLYGVKSDALDVLLAEAALDGRVRSVDSMAWDVEARVRFRTGRTIARRASVMQDWYGRQAARSLAAVGAAQFGIGRSLFSAPAAPVTTDDTLLESYLDLVACGELTLESAMIHYEREAYEAGARSGFRGTVRPRAHRPVLAIPAAPVEQAALALFPPPPLSLPRAA